MVQNSGEGSFTLFNSTVLPPHFHIRVHTHTQIVLLIWLLIGNWRKLRDPGKVPGRCQQWSQWCPPPQAFCGCSEAEGISIPRDTSVLRPIRWGAL